MPSCRLARVLLSVGVFFAAAASRRSGAQYGPYAEFRTEPELEPSPFNVKNLTDDASKLSKDYFIFSVTSHGGPPPWGPQIVDWEGNLVFYGADIMGKAGQQDPHVCDFHGSTGQHLCANQVYFTRGIGMELNPGAVLGRKVIYDEHYEEVNKGYGAAGNLGQPNNHDFNMMPGGESFLQPIYQHRNRNLKPYGGPQNGALSDGCLQEINVRTGKVMFQWCYLDHFPPWWTYIYLDVPGNTVNLTSHIAGKGQQHHPWDFMHINAVDKDEDGDYLVSARHMNQAIKIAGPNNKYGLKPGETVWRLNGKNGDLDMIDNFTFSRQHHTRFVNKTGDVQIISLFNNAWEGRNDPTANHSTAQFIRINETARTATLIQELVNPDDLLAAAQGSVSLLSNGNTLVCWGRLKQLSEYDPAGNLLHHIQVGEPNSQDTYRGFKQPWIGRPKWKPKVLLYSQSCGLVQLDPLYVYASWNGATEYVAWRFSTSTTTRDGPWTDAGTYNRTGFETQARLLDENSPFVRYVMAEALDADGNAMEHVIGQIFVPRDTVVEGCGEDYCHDPPRFVYGDPRNKVGWCVKSLKEGLGEDEQLTTFDYVAQQLGMYEFSENAWSLPMAMGLFSIVLGIESVAYLLRFLYAAVYAGTQPHLSLYQNHFP